MCVCVCGFGNLTQTSLEQMIGEVLSSFIISHDQRFTHLSEVSLSLEQRSTFTRAKFSKTYFFKVAFILRQLVTNIYGPFGLKGKEGEQSRVE